MKTNKFSIKVTTCPVCLQKKGRVKKVNTVGHIVSFHKDCWRHYEEMSRYHGKDKEYYDYED